VLSAGFLTSNGSQCMSEGPFYPPSWLLFCYRVSKNKLWSHLLVMEEFPKHHLILWNWELTCIFPPLLDAPGNGLPKLSMCTSVQYLCLTALGTEVS
jgi:hypothetical protein